MPATRQGDDLNPYAAPTANPVDEEAGRGGAGTFALMGLLSGLGFWLAWSAWMAAVQGRPYREFFLGAGLGAGVFFGIFYGIFMARAMRRVSTTIPVPDRAAWLSRLDRELGKLRYRAGERTGEAAVYRIRTPFRPRAFDIVARLGPDSATITGPKATLRMLEKRLGRPER